jgi:hypothetical protein
MSIQSVLAIIDRTTAPQAWKDVISERVRQVTEEGWSAEHDDAHEDGEIERAGAAYAAEAGSMVGGDLAHSAALDLWPWDWDWWKPGPRRGMLVKAGALILAAIERIDRKEAGKAS